MHTLQRLRCGLRHFHTCTDRTSDRHHRRRIVRDHRAPCVAVTADDIEDAGRQELGCDFCEQRCGGWRGVRWLQDDCVSGSDRWCELPHRHHHRVVPRRDLRTHPDRLTSNHGRHATHVLSCALSFEHARRTCKEADLVDHRRNFFTACKCDRLAGVLNLERDDLICSSFDCISDTKQRKGPLRWRGVLPVFVCSCRRRHRGVDIGLPAQRRLGIFFAGHRIDHVGSATVFCRLMLPVDEVLKGAHGHSLSEIDGTEKPWPYGHF